ncbi:MAG: hypothetical protein RL216_3500 [Pseudomonadota bacterium]|jgi:hypothetical protein
MRWWPPFLHLLVIAAIVPLAALRVGAALEDGSIPVVPVPPGGEAAVDAAGEAVVDVTGTPVDLEALVVRPLFVPGRQGAAAVVEAPAAEVPEPALGLRMVGYLDDGTKPRAILSVDSTGVEAIVREGDAFEGFEVRQITRDAVVVINRGEEITVKLFDQ